MPDRSSTVNCIEASRGSTTPFGYRYGWLTVAPYKSYAVGQHVAAFTLAWGPVPPGKIVRHTCDNPPCVNPLHLMIGTYGDNMRDRTERGRALTYGGLCKRGHDLAVTGEPCNGGRSRRCSECRRNNRKKECDHG
jgi:hypothetical protein